MQLNKPYAFLSYNPGNRPKFDVAIYCYYQSGPTYSSSNGILTVTYRVGTGTPATRVDQNKYYAGAVDYSIIFIKVVNDSTGDLLGSVTLHITDSYFDPNNSAVINYKPLCYLKTQNTALPELYVRVDNSAAAGAKALDPNISILAIPNEHKVIIYIDELTTGAPGVFEYSVDLISYPVSTYEYIEVDVRDSTKTITKGKGTTDQSDADSSSDK